MNPARYIPRYTYSDYLLWEGNWEMIDGVPHSMSPSASGKHQWLASLLTTEIVISIRKNAAHCGHCFSVQDVDWIISDDTVLRPDLAVVCGPVGDFITSAPAVIIEILSPSSGQRDRIIKREIYEEQGVKYYIIADPSARTWQAYKLTDGRYQDYSDSAFELHTGCTIMIDVTKALAEFGG